MAKHPTRRRQPLFVPTIKASHAVGALAANDAGVTPFTQLLDQEVFAISMDVLPVFHGATTTEGPLLIGVAHSDYSAAEIEEAIEASGSWERGDKIANEQSRRKVRVIGSFVYDATSGNMNDGRKIRVKLGFVIEDGKGLSLWVYNDSSATLTTGGIVELTGKAFLSPR